MIQYLPKIIKKLKCHINKEHLEAYEAYLQEEKDSKKDIKDFEEFINISKPTNKQLD